MTSANCSSIGENGITNRDEKKYIPGRVAMDAFEVLVGARQLQKTHRKIHCIRKMENIPLQRLKAEDGRCI